MIDSDFNAMTSDAFRADSSLVGDEFDLVEGFAAEITVAMLCAILGPPRSDKNQSANGRPCRANIPVRRRGGQRAAEMQFFDSITRQMVQFHAQPGRAQQ